MNRISSLSSLALLSAIACQVPNTNNQPPMVQNHRPVLQITDPGTGGSIQTPGDFGASNQTTYMSSYQYNCWEPVQLEYSIFDRDGDVTEPLAYMPDYQWSWNYEPFNIEVPNLQVIPEFQSDFYPDELLPLSGNYFIPTNADQGVFEFQVDGFNLSRSWYFDAFFTATDGEAQTEIPLQVRFHMMCG